MNFDPLFSGDVVADRILNQYIKLIEATRRKDVAEVQKLHDKNAPVNHHLSGCYNLTPLHLAVQSRSLDIAKILMDMGANMNAKNVIGETPLILAAKSENTPMTDLFLSYEVSNEEDNTHFSHLHIACMKNRVDVVRQLLRINQGENLNKAVGKSSMFWQGYTPLHFAVRYGCIETVEFLLKCEADIMVHDLQGSTPLHLADFQRNEPIIDLLLSAHKSEFKNPSSQQDLTHFHIACTRDDPSVVEHFLKLGVDMNLSINGPRDVFWKDWKPIHFAMYYECPKVIDLLLQSGVNIESGLFSKLLRHRHIMGCIKVYEKCMSSISISAENPERISKLHQICIQNTARPWMIEKLKRDSAVNSPLDLKLQIWTGCTSLHLAVKYRSTDIIKYLLNQGVDATIEDNNCKTPLHIAFYRRFRDILLLIVEKLSDGTQSMVDCDGLSIFHILYTTDKLTLIEKFVDSGVEINAKVSDNSELWAGFTPLHFACIHTQPEVVKLLLDNHADIQVTNRMNLNPFDLSIEKMATEPPFTHKKYFKVLEKIFLDLSSEADQKLNTRGISLLHILCCTADDESFKILEQCFVDYQDKVNSSIQLHQKHPYNGDTPLHLAIKFGNLDKADFMLEHGADSLMVNGKGKTVLECAFFKGPSNVLAKHEKTLFSYKVVNQTSRPSHFYMACCVASSVVRHVLKTWDDKTKKAVMMCRNDSEQTPIHLLMMGGSSKMSPANLERIRLLLINGAHAGAQDHELRTPLHYAHRFDDCEIVELLADFGADVNARDLYGNRPLFQFSDINSEMSVAILLDKGADINIKDKKGLTCLTKKVPSLSADPVLAYHIDSEQKCIAVMLKHIKRLQLIGKHVSEENMLAYVHAKSRFNTVFDETTYENECKKELGSMMTVNIDCYTTLRDILSKSLEKMVYHCENEDLLKMITDEFYKKYPIYGRLVALQFNNGARRQHLLFHCNKCLNFLNGIPLPQMCKEMILQYLSNADLLDIINKAK